MSMKTGLRLVPSFQMSMRSPWQQTHSMKSPFNHVWEFHGIGVELPFEF